MLMAKRQLPPTGLQAASFRHPAAASTALRQYLSLDKAYGLNQRPHHLHGGA